MALLSLSSCLVIGTFTNRQLAVIVHKPVRTDRYRIVKNCMSSRHELDAHFLGKCKPKPNVLAMRPNMLAVGTYRLKVVILCDLVVHEQPKMNTCDRTTSKGAGSVGTQHSVGFSRFHLRPRGKCKQTMQTMQQMGLKQFGTNMSRYGEASVREKTSVWDLCASSVWVVLVASDDTAQQSPVSDTCAHDVKRTLQTAQALICIKSKSARSGHYEPRLRNPKTAAEPARRPSNTKPKNIGFSETQIQNYSLSRETWYSVARPPLRSSTAPASCSLSAHIAESADQHLGLWSPKCVVSNLETVRARTARPICCARLPDKCWGLHFSKPSLGDMHPRLPTNLK